MKYKLSHLESIVVITLIFNGSGGIIISSNFTLPLDQHKVLHSSFHFRTVQSWQTIVGFPIKTDASFL